MKKILRQTTCMLLSCLFLNAATAQFGIHQSGDNPLSPVTYPFLKGCMVTVKWTTIEPDSAGKYTWTSFDSQIKQWLQKQLPVILLVWVRVPNDTSGEPPKWLFTAPTNAAYVYENDHCPGCTGVHKAPYYPDTNYQREYRNMVMAVARRIKDSNSVWQTRYGANVISVQACLGPTGDAGLYKDISSWNGNTALTDADEFLIFKQFTNYYDSAYTDVYPGSGVHVLYNASIFGQQETSWLRDASNFGAYWQKLTGWDQSYQLPENKTYRLPWLLPAVNSKRLSEYVRTRCEISQDIIQAGWWQQKPYQNMFAALSCGLYEGLDIADFDSTLLKNTNYKPAFDFFVKYAGQKDTATATNAFCALRFGLNDSDVVDFPPITGETNASGVKRQLISRYVRIAGVAGHGAGIRDTVPPSVLTGGGVAVSGADSINDVGWDIYEGNFHRYLYQIAPNETSIAYWNVNTSAQPNSIFGRYARGFNHANTPSPKDTMYFDIDDHFLDTSDRSHGGIHVMLKYTYLDSGSGSNSKFRVYYDALSGANKLAKIDTIKNTNNWITDSVNITDGYFGNRNTRNSDFGFLNIGNTFNIIFSVIEIEKRTAVGSFAKQKSETKITTANSLLITPNPADNYFRVALKDGSLIRQIRVYSPDGSLIVDKRPNSMAIQISKAELHQSHGVCNIVVMYGNNQQVTGKVIIN